MSKNTNIFLDTLQKILSKLDPASPLQAGLEGMMATVSQVMNYKRIALAIFDPQTNVLKFNIIHGQSQIAPITYSPGQGVTGHVLSTKKSMIIPIMADDPMFLNKAFGRSKEEMETLAFIGVPVLKVGNAQEVLGVLSIDLEKKEQIKLEMHALFLEVLAAIIARQTAYLQEVMVQKKLWAGMPDNMGHSSLARSKIVGVSKVMGMIMVQLEQVAPSKATILLRGESGTGKELLAEAIHNSSDRQDKPFIKLNCATLPSHLLESELFGHERGAFTGAVGTKRGRFELAHKGTLFLDEIGELSAEAQAKLLRAIQEGEIQRLGSEKTINVDVRIVCATHQPLEQLIEEQKFREDLYYRINVFPIFIPALRERREDILPLAEHFLQTFSKEYGKNIKRISTPAIDLLTQYHWPGNVRELRNCLERAVLLCNDEAIRTYHLPPTLQTAESSATDTEFSFGESVARFEQELLVDALKKAKGNMLQAARNLRTSYRIIHYKIKKYNINPKKYAVAS